jgi:hypothetical protein
MESHNIEIKPRDARGNELNIIPKLLVAAYQEYKEFMPADRWDWYRNDMIDDPPINRLETNSEVCPTLRAHELARNPSPFFPTRVCLF